MAAEHRKLTDRIELRPVTMPEDDDLLHRIYASTRDDIKYLPFDEAGKRAFVEMQYKAQRDHYAVHYAGARSYIILHDGHPAGRHMIDYGSKDIRLVDTVILPEFRNLGIGTVIFRDAFRESMEMGLPCVLHVIKESPAIRLYRRLGFRVVGETGIHDRMEWRPETAPAE
jgi:ribosomal protein S18 acetylase RimI-like enzyme